MHSGEQTRLTSPKGTKLLTAELAGQLLAAADKDK